MSQPSSEKYLHFTVGLLKDSAALDALWQDALKHHMVDQPGQLIALRLTEYYEMMTRGIVQPIVRVPAIVRTGEEEIGEQQEKIAPLHTPTPSPFAMRPQTPLPSEPVHTSTPSPVPAPSNNTLLEQITGRMRALRRDNDSVISASPTADQNADEAADYWTTL